MARRRAAEPVIEEEEAPPPPTHNQGRPMTPEALKEWLQETWQSSFARRDEILAGIERALKAYPTIPDDDVLKRLTDFCAGKGLIGKFLAAADRLHEEEKEPWLAGGRVVDGTWHDLIDAVKRGQKELRNRMTLYATEKAEKERQRREQAALVAAEAARKAAVRATKSMEPDALEQAAQHYQRVESLQREAQQPDAAMSRTYGDLGTVGSLKTRWAFDYEKSDLMALVKAVAAGTADIRYLQFNTQAIGYAVRSEGLRSLPGCAIEEVKSYG